MSVKGRENQNTLKRKNDKVKEGECMVGEFIEVMG